MITELNTPTTWDRAVEIANVPAVHEAIATLCEDATEDNAVCAIQAIMDAALTQRPAALQPGASNEATTQAQGDSSGDVQVDQGRIRDADSRVGSTVPELTQRPAAQSEAQALAHNMMLWREDAVHNGNEYVPVHVRTLEKVIAQLRDMPAPQQATPGFDDCAKSPTGKH